MLFLSFHTCTIRAALGICMSAELHAQGLGCLLCSLCNASVAGVSQGTFAQDRPLWSLFNVDSQPVSFTMPHVMQCHASHLSPISGMNLAICVCKGFLHMIMHAKVQCPLRLPSQCNRMLDSQSASIDGVELA